MILCNCSEAQQFNLDINQSKLNWTGKAAFNAYSLSGILLPESGSIYIKDNIIQTAILLVDMTSLDTENNDLKNHLRSKDFFEVKKFTQSNFKLKEPFNIQNHSVVKGTMKIKEKSVNIELPLIFEKDEQLITIKGTMVIDRTQFGIKYNSPSFFKQLKDQAIADDFILDFELVFIQANLH